MKSSKMIIKNLFNKYSDDELIVRSKQIMFDIRNIPFKRDVTPTILEILRAREVFRNICINEKKEGKRDSINKINARFELLSAITHLIKLLFIDKDKTVHALNNSWRMMAIY